MPKYLLTQKDQDMCCELIETFIAGHKSYRPDLPYPESHSDMEGGIRAVMERYEIKRRPIDKPLERLEK